MSRQPSWTARLHLIAADPPFRPEHGVSFGLQAKQDVENFVPATATAGFDTRIEVVADGGGHDFKGDHVHGPRGDRFLYLAWGLPDGAEPFVMFARAKIKLSDIPGELIGRVAPDDVDLVCEVQATNAKGQPATGTIRPPLVSWRART